MRRRRLVLGGLAALAAPRMASAQGPARTPRVGYLFSFVPSSGQHLWEACRQGLRALGYAEGQNIALEPRWADGHHDRLPALVDDLLRARVDVMVTAATPATQAARAATRTLPIVMVAVADPVKAGVVESLSRPGGNVTGLTLLTPELAGKRLQLLVELLGTVPRVAVLTNPANASAAVFLEETRKAAETTGTVLQILEARGADELDPVFDTATRSSASAMIVLDDPVLWTHRARIVSLAARHRIPVMYGYREFVDGGGLISYGPSRPDLYRRTAAYVDKILRGARPNDLPVERPTKFEMLVNRVTARSLGLVVPPSIVLQADLID